MGEEHHGAVEISYTGEHDPGRIGAEIPPCHGEERRADFPGILPER